jgi:hypothetical protein
MTNTKIIKTEISLHLNFEVFIFYFVLFYFIYVFFLSFIFFIFILIFTLFILNPLSVSLMPLQLMVDQYTVSPCLCL